MNARVTNMFMFSLTAIKDQYSFKNHRGVELEKLNMVGVIKVRFITEICIGVCSVLV